MVHPPSFEVAGKKNIVCKLRKSIYGLKQALRQWYLKFNQIVTSYGFKENIVDQRIYIKVNRSSYIFLVLYVDDILLVFNDFDLLSEIKSFLFGHFDIKNLGEASYILCIQILCDKTNDVLRLS